MGLTPEQLNNLERYFKNEDGQLAKDRQFDPEAIVRKAHAVLNGSEELAKKLVRSSADFAGKLPTATYRALMNKSPKHPEIVAAENWLASQGIRSGAQLMAFKEAGRVVNPLRSENMRNLPRNAVTNTSQIASDAACDSVGIPRGSTWAQVIDASKK
jgi:hypothetical protein